MLDPALALAIRSNPGTLSVMTQRWDGLLFCHYCCSPDLVQELLPPRLTVDTFPDESGVEMAWVGFVPFQIQKLRLLGGVAVPTASTFLETNVRTYVHLDGKDPGVWFFSLDAQSRLACLGARLTYSLPYFQSWMQRRIDGPNLRFAGHRKGDPAVSYEVEASIGEERFEAEPGTLEFFLIERYLLYSRKGENLFSGRVHHTPYPLVNAKLTRCQENLSQTSGLPDRPYIHTLFSPGVEPSIYPLLECR